MLIAGSGQVAQSILEQFKRLHFTATLRPTGDVEHKRSVLVRLGASIIGADLSNKRHIARLACLANRVIWLAPPTSEPCEDKSIMRWFLSRLARKTCPTRAFITYVSTTGVYGNTEGEWIDEKVPVRPQSERAIRRVNAENQIKKAFQMGWASASILRAPGIYSHSRLPLARIKNQTPAITSDEDSYSNHIHEIDLARLCIWATIKPQSWQVINACDNEPTKMGDFFDMVADAFNLQRPPRLPKAAVQDLVSPMMWSFMRESRKIRSLGIAKLGFKLKYPRVATCLEEITDNHQIT